jgi:hypothetical protein
MSAPLVRSESRLRIGLDATTSESGDAEGAAGAVAAVLLMPQRLTPPLRWAQGIGGVIVGACTIGAQRQDATARALGIIHISLT